MTNLLPFWTYHLWFSLHCFIDKCINFRSNKVWNLIVQQLHYSSINNVSSSHFSCCLLIIISVSYFVSSTNHLSSLLLNLNYNSSINLLIVCQIPVNYIFLLLFHHWSAKYSYLHINSVFLILPMSFQSSILIPSYYLLYYLYYY